MKEAVRILTENRETKTEVFRPFEMELKCPACAKEIGLVVSKVHMDIDIYCPACSRPLSAIVRKEIRKRG